MKAKGKKSKALALIVPDSKPLKIKDSRESLSWDELRQLVIENGYDTSPDLVNGPTNSKSTMRLFGKEEKDIRVTLYRDDHA